MKITEKLSSLPRSDIQALYITFGFLAISYVLQVYIYWSPMTLDETAWQKSLDFRFYYPPFVVRPLQSYATLALHKFIGLPIREAFFILQFSLAAAMGFTFYRLLMLLEFGSKWSLIGLALLMSSYPIFGAHFAPTNTCDDFWCYLSLILMLTALIKNKPAQAGIFFLIACLAREQTVLFLPLLFFWNNPLTEKESRVNFIITAIIPLTIFCAYRIIVWRDISPDRWQLFSYNFENAARTTDSIVSLIISFGFVWILFLIGMVNGKNLSKSKAISIIKASAPIVLVLNCLAALFFSLIRESRILFPPFVLVIPVALIAAKDLSQKAVETINSGKTFPIKAAIIFGTFGFFLAERILFTQFDYNANSELRGPLARIYIILDITIFLFWIIPKIKTRFFPAPSNN